MNLSNKCEFKSGEIVIHKADPQKERLRVVDTFYWINGYKVKCQDSHGNFVKDWESYFSHARSDDLPIA